MTHFLLSWLRGASGRKPARRRSFVPRVFLLEDRTLLSVQFTPAPYAVPANRPDTPLTRISALHPVEPYLSVNPADPGDIAVSSHSGIRVSTSAGGSFTGNTIFPVTSGGTDTSTTYDSAGRLFWVTLTNPGGLWGISIAQVDPTTGGILNTHVVDQVPDSSFSDDKDFVAADPSNNNLYVIWTRYGPGNNPHIMMRYSSNQGVSWSAPVQVDNGSDNEVHEATVTVAPDHRVYAAYHSVSCIDQPDCGSGRYVPNHDGKIVVVRFNNDLTDPVPSIAELPGRADITFNIQTDGFPRKIPGAQFYTHGSIQPWILADPVRPGNIYVISSDGNNGFHQDYGDIRLARSTDSGLTWSSRLIETSSTFFPNAAIDQFGDIVVAWYDNRRGLDNPAGHFKLDVYATYSTDGGLTFAPAFPVNDQTPGVNTPDGNIFDPDPGAVNYRSGPPPTTWIGEYFGIGVWGGTAYVAWNGNLFAGFNNPIDQQVWTKAFAIRGSLTVTGTPGNDFITIRSIAGNPAFVEVIVNGQRQYAGLWSALTSITVTAGPGDDIIQIDDTAAGIPVTVNLGNGTDVVEIARGGFNLDTIQGPVTVHGGSGTGTVIAEDSNYPTNTSYAITGSSVSRPGSAVISYNNISRFVSIRGGFGNNTYNVLGTLQSPVQVFAGISGLGSNTLNIDDGFNAANTIYTITGSSVARTGSGDVIYINITNLVTNGGNGTNTYNVLSTPSLYPTSLNTGSGVDTVNVQSTAGPLSIVSAGGGGLDIVNIGNAGSVQGILGSVTVTNPVSFTRLNVDDSSDPNPRSVNLSASGLIGIISGLAPAPIDYATTAINSLTVRGGTGGNTLTITALLVPTTLATGSGGDTVHVLGSVAPLTIDSGGGDTITLRNGAGTLGGIGRVTVNDPSNTATVTVDDSGFAGSTTYTMTSTQMGVAAWPNFVLLYDNLARLNLDASSGSDLFNIEGTASPTATAVNAGTGGNRFNLTPTAQRLAGVAGPLSLLGGGADTLVFWDTANPNAETYTFDDIPSTLALATLPTFATSWSGMAAVYLETNGMSMVNDPSGRVLVDVPPPGSPDTPQEPVTPSAAAERTPVQVLLEAAPKRNAAPRAPLAWDAIVADLLHQAAKNSQENLEPQAWAALDV
jgi:hypothetical protein